MMPFRRRMQAPIQSDKHETTWSNLGQDAGTAKISILLAKAVQPSAKDNATEYGIGSKVKGFYLEFHFSPAQTANANVIHWVVTQIRTGQSASNPNTYYQTDRSQILKRGMEMLPTNVSTVFKRIMFVRIPPFMQRMKENQEFYFVYQASSTQTINACGFAISKEIS